MGKHITSHYKVSATFGRLVAYLVDADFFHDTADTLIEAGCKL